MNWTRVLRWVGAVAGAVLAVALAGVLLDAQRTQAPGHAISPTAIDSRARPGLPQPAPQRGVRLRASRELQPEHRAHVHLRSRDGHDGRRSAPDHVPGRLRCRGVGARTALLRQTRARRCNRVCPSRPGRRSPRKVRDRVRGESSVRGENGAEWCGEEQSLRPLRRSGVGVRESRGVLHRLRAAGT